MEFSTSSPAYSSPCTLVYAELPGILTINAISAAMCKAYLEFLTIHFETDMAISPEKMTVQ